MLKNIKELMNILKANKIERNLCLSKTIRKDNIMKYGKIIEGDYIYKEGDDLSQVEKITGGVDVHEGASLDLSSCTSIGSYVEVSEGCNFSLPVSLHRGLNVKNLKANKIERNLFIAETIILLFGLIATIITITIIIK